MKSKYYSPKKLKTICGERSNGKTHEFYNIQITKHTTHICGETCALYNSLGCPYSGCGAINTGEYCDEWRCKNGEK